jgi:uncharacterized membrane protein YidH (DUF202 family)
MDIFSSSLDDQGPTNPFPLYGVLINAFLLVLTLCILVYSLICLRRVFKIFRFTEVPLFFNNLCISLSCILYISNASIYLAYLVKNYGKQGS